MLGLFGTIDLGQRAMQTQQQGMEVTGHNLANVNQPGYTRQRLVVQTSAALPTSIGAEGTGIQGVAIQQIRSALVDQQMQSELSVRGSLEAQQVALQMAQAGLGQQIDTSASNAQGSAATTGIAGNSGLAQAISDLFNGFQGLATQPTQAESRQALVVQAQNLADRFHQIDQQLSQTRSTLNDSVKLDVASANTLLQGIGQLNQQIAEAEQRSPGSANDLRDTRQQQIETLSKLVKIDSTDNGQNGIQISIGGVSLVSGSQVADTLQAYDAGGGQINVRTTNGGAPLTLTGGSLHGTLEARDGALAKMQGDLDHLASTLVTEVNNLHRTGYSLTGTTGADFFQGDQAANLAVNQNLADQPNLIQASSSATARSDNQVALALAQLGGKSIAGLGGLTFSQSFAQTVTGAGQSLADLNSQLDTQKVVENMLAQQRDSISGVSIDEELTTMMQYQKAYQASAKLITIVSEMLDTVLSLK